MKRCCLLVISMLMGFVLTSGANAPAKAPAKAAAPAKKAAAVVDPKQAAEDARFEGVAKSHRKALLELDQLNEKLVDAWVEAYEAMTDGDKLTLVWGVKARRDADKRLASLATILPRAKDEFQDRYEKQDQKFERELKKLNKEIEKLGDRPTSSSERLREMQNKELADLKAEAQRYEDLRSAMRAMDGALNDYKSSGKGSRLTQLGVAAHDRNLLNALQEHERIIEAAYDIKDIKADIAVLEARKKEGTEWKPQDEGSLSTANRSLEQAGSKLENLVERERKTLKREIDGMKSDIERLAFRVKGLPEDSKSLERINTEKWDLETVLLGIENLDALFVTLATWKEPAPKKAGH